MSSRAIGIGHSRPPKYCGTAGFIPAIRANWIAGTWRIVGRIKNLIVLGSGHKLAPESMEDEIQRLLPNAQQVVIIGNGRGYLSAIITGDAEP